MSITKRLRLLTKTFMVTICIMVLFSNKTKELQSLTTLARLMESGKKPDLFIELLLFEIV